MSMELASLIKDFGFPMVAAMGLGYFVYYIWKWVTEEIKPVLGSASSTLTVASGTMDSSSSNGNIVYARNAKVTVADMAMTGQTSVGAYVAQASTNGDVRLIGVSWRGNDCADANGWTGMSDCWVDVSSSS